MPRRSDYDLDFSPSRYGTVGRGASTPSPAEYIDGDTTEIARLTFKYGELRSVVILANAEDGLIRYLIKHNDSPPFHASIPPASRPISFGQLIDVIEEDVHPRDIRFFKQTGHKAAEMADFVTAESTYYPQLKGWYEDEGREWLLGDKLYYATNNFIYVAVAIAVVISLGRVDNMGIGVIEILIIIFFGVSVLSLTWTVDFATGFHHVWRWLIVGAAALVVSRGLSIEHCAALVCGGALTYLIVGLFVVVSSEDYRPITRFRFSGIAHPNSQAAYCALAILSATYLYHANWIGIGPWVFLMLLAAGVLILTRSRTNFWATAAAIITLIVLEWRFQFEQVGLLIIMAMIVLTGAYMLNLRAARRQESIVTKSEVAKSSMKSRMNDLIHLERDPIVRNRVGGRHGLWRDLLSAISEEPVFGYGHGFWSPDRERSMLKKLGWRADSGHSIYLDSMLNSGVTGLLLQSAILMSCISAVFVLDPPEVILIGALAVFVIINGAFESILITPNFCSFSFYLLIAATLP